MNATQRLLLSFLLATGAWACQEQTNDEGPGEDTVTPADTTPDVKRPTDTDIVGADQIEDYDISHDWCSDGGHADLDIVEDQGIDDNCSDWGAEVADEVVPPVCTLSPGGEIGHPLRETLEYVEGGGFESPTPAWEIDFPAGTGQAFPSEDEAFSGTKSMHVVAQEGDTVRLVQRIYFVKGFTFGLSLQVKGGGQVAAAVMPYSAQGPSPDQAVMVDGGGAFPDWTALTADQDVTKNAEYWQVEILITGPADIYIDHISFSAQVYAKVPVPPTPAAPLQLAWLIHIEDPESLVTSESAFTSKALVFEELAKIFHAHGARLVIQPEITILQGAELYDPTWVQRLTDLYGVTWSTHTHGPAGPDVTMDDVIAYTLERKELMESLGSGPVTDHNGNFDMPDLDTLSTVGFTTLSAYKNKYKQFPADGYYLSPWRPSDVDPMEDEPGWSIHDPAGGLVFIPGTGSSVTRYKFQLYDLVERYLTAAISKVDETKVNAYSFVDHVDHFYSLEGLPLNQYLETDEFQEHLAAYEQLFTDLIDPLVASGHVQWATTEDIRQTFEAWEAINCPKFP